ncbi:flavodoxin domain-containing protein [Fusibacter bizertensis]|uniref:Flavodoxin domain-containing protein n=1 Tax=Fusibacter bizertensis TaxID=1488331 RepID=A0ABT6NAF7_9FIRM|nr:flavodoxin domain-containing protein [Fusibacter bizertensis]MDH8677380.1 flavodoxin domain-containing protein [Fusibacter bizertensis]
MKTLILYGSKTGTTELCANKIRANLGLHEVDIMDVKKSKKQDLSQYETVIIGTPLYMGQITGPIKKYLELHHNELMEKKLYFFICGLALGQEGVDLFQKQISSSLFAHASQIKQLGGDIHLDRLNPLYKWMMKKILAKDQPKLGLLEGEIAEFSSSIS